MFEHLTYQNFIVGNNVRDCWIQESRISITPSIQNLMEEFKDAVSQKDELE